MYQSNNTKGSVLYFGVPCTSSNPSPFVVGTSPEAFFPCFGCVAAALTVHASDHFNAYPTVWRRSYTADLSISFCIRFQNRMSTSVDKYGASTSLIPFRPDVPNFGVNSHLDVKIQRPEKFTKGHNTYNRSEWYPATSSLDVLDRLMFRTLKKYTNNISKVQPPSRTKIRFQEPFLIFDWITLLGKKYDMNWKWCRKINDSENWKFLAVDLSLPTRNYFFPIFQLKCKYISTNLNLGPDQREAKRGSMLPKMEKFHFFFVKKIRFKLENLQEWSLFLRYFHFE